MFVLGSPWTWVVMYILISILVFVTIQICSYIKSNDLLMCVKVTASLCWGLLLPMLVLIAAVVIIGAVIFCISWVFGFIWSISVYLFDVIKNLKE